jgi:hypothetical protein
LQLFATFRLPAVKNRVWCFDLPYSRSRQIGYFDFPNNSLPLNLKVIYDRRVVSTTGFKLKLKTMKKLIIIAAAFSLASCSKIKLPNQNQCYICTFGTVNGQSFAPVEYCGTDGPTHQFTDANGNPIQSNCKVK